MELCEYGCGNPSQFILKNGKHCCSIVCNKCPVIRKKNSTCRKGIASKKKKPDKKVSCEFCNKQITACGYKMNLVKMPFIMLHIWIKPQRISNCTMFVQ